MGSDFQIIETMLWEKGEVFLLDYHLRRMENSAQHFSFSFGEDIIREAIARDTEGFSGMHRYKMRVLLSKDGKYSIESSVIKTCCSNKKTIAFSDKVIDKENVFLYHKTTNRNLYTSELEKYRKTGFFDVLFLNTSGEITESCIANLIIKKDNTYYTPPLGCGLLPGVYRQFLLESQDINIKEKVLFKKDLFNANKIFLANSVMKMVEVFL